MQTDNNDHWFLNGKKVLKQQMLSKSNHQIIDGVTITLEASFGCLQTPIRKNCLFVNDDTLMFISGKHIVLYDIIRKRQTYIMKSAEDESVQTLNFYLTSSNKLLIALGFKSTNKILPTVKVYNRKKKRFYQCVHSHLLPGTNVFEILFINSGKHLLSISKAEDGYGLSLFNVSKEVSVSFTPIKAQISLLEPCGEFEFYLIGPSHFTLFKYMVDLNGIEETANLISELHLDQDEFIVGCAYIIEKKSTIIATSLNNLILLKDNKYSFKSKIQAKVNQSTQLISTLKNKEKTKFPSLENCNFTISTISKTSKGFIIGLMGIPALQVYDIDDNQINLIGTYFIKDDHIYGIHQIHLASDEMYAALTVIHLNRTTQQISNQLLNCEQILENYQGKLELFTFNLAIIEALKTVEKDPFEPLFEKGVHRGMIFNVAITPMRSLMASVCEDKTIKFWDYSNDFKELFSHWFHEVPLSVAIHPLSYQCAVGFKDGLRFFFILDDDLKPVHTETTKACNCITYSDGGHLLAAANGNAIQIYNPQTYQMMYILSNHQANLKELQFVERDQLLISQCTYGILYVWNMLTKEKVVEHAQKLNKYHCLYYDHEYDLIIGVSEQKLKVYNEKGANLALEVDTSPTQLSAICVSHRYNAIFFGTNQGSIRIYSYPFYHFNPKTMEYIEIPVHQLAVSQIKVSPDNGFLISSSVDGSIFFSKIKQFINGIEVSQLDLISRGDIESKVTNTFALNTLCLCSKTALESRKQQLKELEYKLQNFKSDIDDAKEDLQNQNDQKLHQISKQNEQQKNQQKERSSMIYKESDMKMNKLKQDMVDLRKKSKQVIEKMEDEHSQQLLHLYKVRDELQEKLVIVEQQQDDQTNKIMLEYQQSIGQVDDEYCQKYQDLYQRFSEAMNNMKLDQKKFKEVLQQSEKDYETYYKESQESLQEKLSQHTNRTTSLRASISKFRKDNQRLMHRSEFLTGLIKDTSDQVDGLKKELFQYREKHRNMINDLREKEKLINQREQQIKDFRMKNVHLQNFQKVYDYRVNTLKEEREPLMEHLKNMEKHVKNLYNELIEESGLKQQRKEEKDKLNTDQRILQQQLKSALTVLSLSERKMENFRFALQQLLISDTNDWRTQLKELHESLSNENSKAIKIKNPVFQETLKDMQKDPIQQQIDLSQQNAIYKELSSQKFFLQKKLSDVETAVKYQLDQRQDAYYSVQAINEKLIAQCTDLREKKQRLKEYIDKQNKTYREIKRELSSQGIEIHEDEQQQFRTTQFSKTHATGFTGLTRTPGTQSQQNFRTKKIRNLQ